MNETRTNEEMFKDFVEDLVEHLQYEGLSKTFTDKIEDTVDGKVLRLTFDKPQPIAILHYILNECENWAFNGFFGTTVNPGLFHGHGVVISVWPEEDNEPLPRFG